VISARPAESRHERSAGEPDVPQTDRAVRKDSWLRALPARGGSHRLSRAVARGELARWRSPESDSWP